MHRAIGRFKEALVDVFVGSEYNALLQLVDVVVSPTRESDLKKLSTRIRHIPASFAGASKGK
jgi:hypothetical protein